MAAETRQMACRLEVSGQASEHVAADVALKGGRGVSPEAGGARGVKGTNGMLAILEATQHGYMRAAGQGRVRLEAGRLLSR